MNTNPHRDDDYLPCQDYIIEGNDSSGITRFENEGKFYFSFSENNKIILRSEGYSNEAGRENGIASVLKNINNEGLYHTRRLPDGRWILSLKAGNHQEIARSCPFNTEEEVLVLMPGARKRATSQINLAAVEAGSIEQEGISFADDSSVGQNVEDDYMICREYEEKISSKHPEYSDFICFKHENTGKYYFAMINKNNEIVFRSEGYPTTAARDNGIESVRKNREIPERISVDEQRNLFFLVIKAGNHQEIGRSCPFTSKDQALALLQDTSEKRTTANVEDDYMICREYEEKISSKHPEYSDFISFKHENTGKYYFAMINKNNEIVFRSEGYPTTAARDNGIESVRKNREIPERISVDEQRNLFFLVIKAGNHQEIGRSCPFTSKDQALALLQDTSEKRTSANVEDDYMICREYEEKISSKHPEYSDFISFKHENTGKYYFAMINKNNEIVFRSEGYPTTAARDNGIESVRKNRDNKQRLSVEENRGLYFLVLKAGNHQEIARSCPKQNEAALWALFEGQDSSIPAAAAALATVGALTALDSPNVSADKEDDYLTCEEYKGHPVNDKVNNVAFFKKNELYYFVVYNSNGSVRLRSEGFVSADNRDKELKGVLKYIDTKEKYETIEKAGYRIHILKDESDREVGRSCAEKIVATAAPIIPPAATITKVGESKSGFNWWWLLLPLLLLLGFLLFTKTCKKQEVVPADLSTVEEKTNTTTDTVPVTSDAVTTKTPDCGLRWIYFPFDQYVITSEANAELEEMAKILSENPTFTGLLSAHTDSRGSDDYNARLSENRANAAKDILIKLGIDAGRINTSFESESKPIAINTDDDTGRKFNRRVELHVLDGSGKEVCKSIPPDVPENLKNK
ncbi:MAG: DUF1508 domain-containing protein [Saprospiraceae bacterium]|nr:DUF1508 domain-containing protein [Saprospiraceae bacterium]